MVLEVERLLLALEEYVSRGVHETDKEGDADDEYRAVQESDSDKEHFVAVIVLVIELLVLIPGDAVNDTVRCWESECVWDAAECDGVFVVPLDNDGVAET